ncbi:hypothetical protein [Capnocytophaga sp. G2]|uniref:hypothetical protein n=1 Tax=Capnocytophaga sp. G2 TaxID=3110695 RepID=UPI002B49448B|nr:hypothetical protein [Capnocytophaga sp. G2]MEB3005770.1 hypothetical protein [Capnocytophaga sp. G2]
MTAITTLKKWFSNFKRPTQEQFWEWLDSFWHKNEKIPMDSVEGLSIALEGIASTEQLRSHLNDSQAHKELFDKKVDMEEGKGLSANDFTDELKKKLENLRQEENYGQHFSGNLIKGDTKFIEFNYSGNNIHYFELEYGLDTDIYLLGFFGEKLGDKLSMKLIGTEEKEVIVKELDNGYYLLDNTDGKYGSYANRLKVEILGNQTRIANLQLRKYLKYPEWTPNNTLLQNLSDEIKKLKKVIRFVSNNLVKVYTIKPSISPIKVTIPFVNHITFTDKYLLVYKGNVEIGKGLEITTSGEKENGPIHYTLLEKIEGKSASGMPSVYMYEIKKEGMDEDMVEALTFSVIKEVNISEIQVRRILLYPDFTPAVNP